MKSNDESHLMHFLNKLGFIIVFNFECPIGATIDRDLEAESAESSFKLKDYTTQALSYTLPIHANGAREISISVSLRDDVTFAGKDSIKIKTYIALNKPSLINLIKLELGSDFIDIFPQSR